MKHMALHYAKYTGYFFQSLENQDTSLFTKTLTDAFIISLASANALNQDLGRELGEDVSSGVSLADLGAALKIAVPREDADPLWLVRAFARHSGTLAKACESWDHLEGIAFRAMMKSSNLALHQTVLIEASARTLDLEIAYRRRIHDIEKCSIFDAHIRTHREEA